MTSENRYESMNIQHQSPVLLITTQHYFQIGRDGIQHYLKWKDGRRETIIFDEAPYIKQTINIDLRSFNRVMSLLQTGAGGAQVDAHEKDWCINQWRHLTSKVEEIIKKYESDDRDDKPAYRFFVNANHTMTEDDGRFFAYINNTRKFLK